MAVDEYSGICDICNKPADARIEDCHTLFCTANCHRETGDLYHADCLKKFIASGAKGTAKHIPKIPYTNFACPKGKGKGSETPCKGVAAHCKRVIVKAEPKSTVPPQVLLQNEKRQKPQPKPAKQAAPQKPAKPKAPPVSDSRPQLRLPPMPVVPKADPLGRNLNGQQQQELPPGYCEAAQAQAEAEKAKQGKAAKKNQKRAAKRKEELGSQWEASSANGSTTDASGMPPLEDFLGPSASQVSLGSGWNNAAAAAGDAEGSVASTGRFITDIDSYHALLAKHLDYSDSDVEYADSEDEEAGDTAESAPAAQWSQQQQLDSEDTAGWQSVGGRGKVTPPAPASAARSRAESTARPEDDREELRRREEELLKAALEASLGDAPGPQGQAAAAAVEDDYEAALARAMQESLAIEEAQRQREQAEQAALYAAIQARQQQQQQQGSSGGGSTPWSAAAASTADSSTAWGTAAGGDSAAAAASWGVVHSQQQQQPQAAYTSNPYTAMPAVVPSSIPPSYSTFTAPQAAVAASATPTALAATYSAPSAATIAAAYQPAAVPQQVPPVPWLQPAAISAPVMPAGYGSMPAAAAVHYKAAPAAAAPAAAAEDDDDLDSLLALLNV